MRVLSTDTTGVERDEWFVVVIGQPGHPEVQRTIQDLDEFDIVSRVDQVRRWSRKRLAVVCPSRMPPRLVDDILAHIQLLNQLAEFRFVAADGDPRQLGQRVVDSLLLQVDAVVVVRGRPAAAVPPAVLRCHRQGVPAVPVRDVSDLESEWFDDCRTVGVVAEPGARTETVNRIRAALARMTARPCLSVVKKR